MPIAGLGLHRPSFEFVAAGVSGNLTYNVGHEHAAYSIDGVLASRTPSVYCREHGEWKIIDGHGDYPPISALTPRRRAVGVTGSEIDFKSTIFMSSQHPRLG